MNGFRPLISCCVVIAFLVGTRCVARADEPTQESAAERFHQLGGVDWREVFYDSGTENWRRNWNVDGEKATISNSELGMDFWAGSHRRENASHAVMWTKQSFEGDIRIDYEYTRLDETFEAVTILYIQATGSGAPGYPNDITAWADKRKVPRMRTYFNHMRLLHISYAAFGVGNTDREADYIRARRYLPERTVGLEGTELHPNYSRTGMFATGVPHKITVIKHQDDLFFHLRNDEKAVLCHWNLRDAKPINAGRIGLRHMWTRGARYRDFRVSQLPPASQERG